MDEETKTTDALSEALGLDSNTTPIVKRIPIPKQNTGSKIEDDNEYARQNLYEVIENAAKAVDLMMNILNESQHPRAAEVLGQLLKQQADTAQQLLKLQKDKKDLNRIDPNDSAAQPTTINAANAIFVGTTSDLLDMINKRDRRIIEHDDMKED